MVKNKDGDTECFYQTSFICQDSGLSKNLIAARNEPEKTLGVHG
jgi:hypothetical protein